jgi:hypothetical protein
MARLETLRRQGPSAAAFTFREAFAAPDAPAASPAGFADECPAS